MPIALRLTPLAGWHMVHLPGTQAEWSLASVLNLAIAQIGTQHKTKVGCCCLRALNAYAVSIGLFS